jgi:hypothetical protein
MRAPVIHGADSAACATITRCPGGFGREVRRDALGVRGQPHSNKTYLFCLLIGDLRYDYSNWKD